MPKLLALSMLLLAAGMAFASSITNCTAITDASGNPYTMTGNLVGAPINASEISNPSFACIKIASSHTMAACSSMTRTASC
jgi:hypothetical protein